VDGSDIVKRGWLSKEIQNRLKHPDCRYVLVTGEPGAGKTGIMAALARANQNWLRYFIRSNSVAPLSSGDAVSFMLRVGHQLAHCHPEIFDPALLEIVVEQRIGQAGPGGTVTGVRIEDLKVSPFYRTAIRVQQEVASLSGGLVGAEISQATVEPRLLEPATLGQLALLDPASGLARREPDEMIVVLVDALDELLSLSGTTILDWLETGPSLQKSNIRLVMTSRPNDRLRTLEGIREGQVEVLRIEDYSREVGCDVRAFASKLLDETGVLSRRPAISKDDALNALGRAARGNFAYLSAYARSLRAANARSLRPNATSGDAETLDELLRFEKLPEGLYPLYATFVRQIRRQIESLGQLEVTTTDGGFVRAWEGAGQPILSILAVALAPLKLDQLMKLGALRVWKSAANNVLRHFVPFLDEFGGAWQFFHPSVGEFLRSADLDAMPDVAVDAREWHTRIVRHYQGGTAWTDVNWRALDDYGLLHVAEHLAAGDPDPMAVSQLVTDGLRVALKARFHSDLPFRRVVARALAGAEQAPELGTIISGTASLGFVLSGLSSGAAQLDPAVYGLMSRLGRTEEALARAEVLTPGMLRFRALEAIRQSTPPVSRAALGPLDGADLLTGAALEVPAATGTLFTGLDRTECLRGAAIAMAPHSLERALRLVDMLERPEDREKERRAVMVAAVAAQPEAAAELIATMPDSGRATAAAAAAAGAGALGSRDTLIALVGENLAAAEWAEQVSACAQVLTLLGPDHPAQSDPWEAALTVALNRLSPDEMTSYRGWGWAVVEAAKLLHGGFPELAVRVLARCEPESVGSSTDSQALNVAETWAVWGRKEECTRLIEKALAYYHGLQWYGPARDIARAASIVAKIDPAWGEQLAGEAMALVEPAIGTTDPFEWLRLDSILAGVVEAFRRWDRVRALRVARWLKGNWVHGGHWDSMSGRGSALALIGLDAADSDPALSAQLLAECMSGDTKLVPLGYPDQRDVGELFALEASGTSGNVHVANFAAHISNYLSYWSDGRNWRVFASPADVLRSLEFPFFRRVTWARAMIAAIVPTAEVDCERAIAFAFRVTDSCEVLVGLAMVAQVLEAADDQRSPQAVRLVEAAWRSLPNYFSAIDLDKLPDQKPLLLFLDPSVRAQFEAAIHLPHDSTNLAPALAGAANSRYVEMVWRAERLFQQIRYGPVDELVAETSRPQIESILDELTSSDPLVGSLVRVAFVFALAPHDAASAELELTRISDLLCRKTAELALVLIESPAPGSAVARSLAFLDRLEDKISPLHRADLAATAAQYCGAEKGSELIRWGQRALEGADALLKARGQITLAGAASDVDAAALLSAALENCDAIGNPYLRSDVLADMLGPVVATKDRRLVKRLIQLLVGDGWNTWTEALRRAMPQLIALLGPGFVDHLDTALRRSQAALGTAPSEPLDGVLARRTGPNCDPLSDALSHLPSEPEQEEPDPAYLAAFLTQEDLGTSLQCVQDSRVGMGADPGDGLYRRLGGRQTGLAVWMDADDNPIWRLVDIRWLFGTAEGAAAYYRLRLSANSEGAPPVAVAPIVGDECAIFGGTTPIPIAPGISLTHYFYIFRVGRTVAKLYAAQGQQASEPLTPQNLAPIARRIVDRISVAV
jgi:hypothetical protein